MAAQLHALGQTLVAVAGTPKQLQVPATINPPSVHAFIIEALPSNLGKIYIGLAGLNKATMVGVLCILPVPSINLLPTFSMAVSAGANPLNLRDLWFDADTSGEGVIVSAVVC